MKVVGFCPMGCGETLFLFAGRVMCSSLVCPQRAAAAAILADSETEHLVTFTDRGFTIRHPLRERLGESLESCGLHQQVQALDAPPVLLGRYRACQADGEYYWERVEQ